LDCAVFRAEREFYSALTLTRNSPDNTLARVGLTSAVCGLKHCQRLAPLRVDLKKAGHDFFPGPLEIEDVPCAFDTYCGRYMYHCHILEHEDRDMMRPIVIMPMRLEPFMS
jgi:hypothetical protein